MTNAQKLDQFHEAIDGEKRPTPGLPTSDVVELRRTLIREEYNEVMEALDELVAIDGDGDGVDSAEISPAIAALMHELADLLYVTYGTFTAFGVDADKVFAEVHRANMQKANGPRRADGKVMKPPDFKRADVAAVIADQL